MSSSISASLARRFAGRSTLSGISKTVAEDDSGVVALSVTELNWVEDCTGFRSKLRSARITGSSKPLCVIGS
jgi:hypothetical protein